MAIRQGLKQCNSLIPLQTLPNKPAMKGGECDLFPPRLCMSSRPKHSVRSNGELWAAAGPLKQTPMKAGRGLAMLLPQPSLLLALLPKYANARNLSPEKGYGCRANKKIIGPTWAEHSNGNVQVFLCADECFKPFLEHSREQNTDQLRIHIDPAAPSSRASRKIPSTKSTTKCRSCTFRECQRVDLDMNIHAYIYIYVCVCLCVPMNDNSPSHTETHMTATQRVYLHTTKGKLQRCPPHPQRLPQSLMPLGRTPAAAKECPL